MATTKAEAPERMCEPCGRLVGPEHRHPYNAPAGELVSREAAIAVLSEPYSDGDGWRDIPCVAVERIRALPPVACVPETEAEIQAVINDLDSAQYYLPEDCPERESVRKASAMLVNYGVARVPTTKCAKCGHNRIESTDGFCSEHLGTDGEAALCGCKCDFNLVARVPDAARAAAEEIQKYTFEVNGIRGGKSLDDIAAIILKHCGVARVEMIEQERGSITYLLCSECDAEFYATDPAAHLHVCGVARVPVEKNKD